MTDNVNHPAHYGGDTTYEVIKVIEAWDLGFALGNTVKYVARSGRKPSADCLEDLRKAAWYLSREIGRLEREAARIEVDATTGLSAEEVEQVRESFIQAVSKTYGVPPEDLVERTLRDRLLALGIPKLLRDMADDRGCQVRCPVGETARRRADTLESLIAELGGA